jgi:glycosyltransferase involved in cell wall biosynthesis
MPERLTGPSMLALIDEVNGPNLWRVLQPVTALERAGYPAGWDFKSASLLGMVAPHVDGYLLPRISWPATHRSTAEAWFETNRRNGKFCVYDMDDDILTSQETHRRVDLNWTEGKSFEQLEGERFQRIWALQQCDGVTVTTQRLATIARSYTTKPVIVVPNAIDIPWFRGIVQQTKRQIPGLTIGWAGGRRHDRDVEEMAIAWGRIARRYRDVTFVVQGHQPEVIREHVPDYRLVSLPWMKAETYPSGIAQVDIGCCAVADTPFNRAKSPIKAMEHAVAGAAVVASETLYSGILENGNSGYIAETADEWEEWLTDLIEHPARRSMMARRLLKTVEKRHSLAGNLHRWPMAWSQIAEATRGRILKLA